MKKIFLTIGMLLSLNVVAEELPSYAYTSKATINNQIVSSHNGFLSPSNKSSNLTVTVNGVAQKLKYNPATMSNSGDVIKKESLFMYVTEKNDFVMSSYIDGCGKFDFASKEIPTEEPLVFTNNNCVYELSIAEL